MRTRSRSRSRNNTPQREASSAIVEPLRIELPFLEDQFQEDTPPESPMADNQTMAELLQAPTEGYEDAIVIPEITANNFELKHGLINLVQNNQFFRHDKEDPHAHIRYFNKITSTTRDMVKALLLDKKNQSPAPTPSTTPAPVKAVEPNYVTYDGAHAYQNCLAAHENAYRDNIQEGNNFNRGGNFNQSNFNPSSFNQGQLNRPQVNQAPVNQAHIPQTQRVSQTDFKSYVKANDAILRNMQSQVWGWLSLPELTPTCMTLELVDRLVSKPIGIAKDVSFKVGVFHFPADFVVVDFEPDPRVPLILGRCFLKTSRALIDVHKEKLTLRIGNKAITYNLDQTEADAFLGLKDDPDSPKINPFYYDPKRDILLLEAILNSEPSPPSQIKNKICVRSKKNLRLMKLKLLNRPSMNLQRLNLRTYLTISKEYKPAVQHQRQVNPKIHDVIKKEVEKLLDAGLIYPISDSPWVSPVHCVPKKGGFTVVENKENELIPTRLVTGLRVCIDYHKLNEATRKDHFPLPFMDQMLERLAGNEYYCFLNGFSG
nr:reverse transcriptase domain-containing protein [Tanacetum cinerariifolium]